MINNIEHIDKLYIQHGIMGHKEITDNRIVIDTEFKFHTPYFQSIINKAKIESRERRFKQLLDG